MKKLILIVLMILTAISTWAQQPSTSTPLAPGRTQISAFGGLSMPLGTYRGEIGRAKDGYFGGISLDKYFDGNKWGIGIDARFLNHDIRKFDTVFFSNGHIAPTYVNKPSFQHIAVSIGPTYKQTFGKIDLEAFLRGGVLFQQFPEYSQSIYIDAAVGPPLKTTDVYHTNNSKNKTNAWMGLGGLRISYLISNNLAVFVQGDYLRAFGKRFGSDSSEFYISKYNEAKSIMPLDVFETKEGIISNLTDFYEERPVSYKTLTQALNAAIGIKFTFGGKQKSVPAVPAPTHTTPKDIVVVVKDKQTGQALSGVTVTLSGNNQDNVSISNSNGQAERITGAVKSTYTITASKNGISATPVSIIETDFDRAGAVIYKEIYHDDPRFTLIGETRSADDNAKLPGISTVLTNSSDNTNMSQVSDGEAKFVYQLEQQSDYTVVANQAGKFSQTESITTKGLDRSKTLYVTLKLGINTLNSGASFVLKNIHYDFDKSNIRPDAEHILNNILNIMIQNPTLKIELSSHTDSRGRDDYNMSLSQRRAESAVNYLIRRGIDSNRLEAKGYGEERLLNRCANGVTCSEEEHQANRRTEIKVLKY